MPINEQNNTVVLGSTDVIELDPQRVWNKVDGVTTVRRIVGQKIAIQTKFNTLAAAADNGADEISENVQDSKGEIYIRVNEDSGSTTGGNTSALNAIWELQNIEVMKPIETASYFDSLTGANKNAILKNVRDASACSVAGAVAAKLYAYLSNHYLDYSAYALSLRKTVTVSSRSTITLLYTGINTVVPVAGIDPPSALLGALPTGWEWLYKGPQCRQVTKTKFQLVSEWIGLTQWAKYPYGGTWDPS